MQSACLYDAVATHYCSTPSCTFHLFLSVLRPVCVMSKMAFSQVSRTQGQRQWCACCENAIHACHAIDGFSKQSQLA